MGLNGEMAEGYSLIARKATTSAAEEFARGLVRLVCEGLVGDRQRQLWVILDSYKKD